MKDRNYREGSWTRGSGSAYRLQRNLYAYKVSALMAGGKAGVCPSCAGALNIRDRKAEVDRADPALDYRPGNICYLCRECNSARGVLQTSGGDWSHVDDYREAVRVASSLVDVPTVTEAKDWWALQVAVRDMPRAMRWA